MSPHERVKLTNYVEGMLYLVRFFGPNYIAPSPIIAHFVDTEDLVYEYVERSFVCVCEGRAEGGVAQPQCRILLPFLTLKYSRNSQAHDVL